MGRAEHCIVAGPWFVTNCKPLVSNATAIPWNRKCKETAKPNIYSVRYRIGLIYDPYRDTGDGILLLVVHLKLTDWRRTVALIPCFSHCSRHATSPFRTHRAAANGFAAPDRNGRRDALPSPHDSTPAPLAMTALKSLAVLAATTLGGLAVGIWACMALDLAITTPPAWLLLGAILLIAAAGGTLTLHRIVIAPHVLAAQTAAAGAASAAVRIESQRRLRHDIRGALSPALLTADRLLTHGDPAVQRAGDIVVRAVERAAALLVDPVPDATPPGPS
jgi:hypothetical protein